MTYVIDGNDIRNSIEQQLTKSIETLQAAGVTPSLATVLMSNDAASETYMSMKHQACADAGINCTHIKVSPTESETKLFEQINELNEDPSVHGILVQMPVPNHVDEREVPRRINPLKDVDGLHPENIGRLVTGDPRFVPCTPHAIQKLLESVEVNPEGKDVLIIGSSNIVGKPLAMRLVQESEGGKATVTICHKYTQELSKKTYEADIVIAAAGVPELVDGSMLSEDTVVIDVGINHVDTGTDGESELVGDVEFQSAKDKASVITPVPGGVGPVTISMLLYNTVKAAGLQEGIAVELP